MSKLSKNAELTVKDFEAQSEKSVEYNGIKLKTVADFYQVSPEDKKTLFLLEKQFKELAEKTVKKEITIDQYAKTIQKINGVAQTQPNIVVSMGKNNDFIVTLKSQLKDEYQTQVQLVLNKEVSKRPAIFSLYAIEWEESESGWGVRPDGFSFHQSSEDATQYIKDYWARQPKEVQYEYSRPCNDKARLIEVSEGLHDYVMEHGSVWLNPKSASAYKTFDVNQLKRA